MLPLKRYEKVQDLNLDEDDVDNTENNQHHVRKALMEKLYDRLSVHKLARLVADELSVDMNVEDFAVDENSELMQVSTYDEKDRILRIEDISLKHGKEINWCRVFTYDDIGNVLNEKNEYYYHADIVRVTENEKKYDQKNRLIEQLNYLKGTKQTQNAKKPFNKICYKYDDIDNLTVEEYENEDLVSIDTSINTHGKLLISTNKKIKEDKIEEDTITIYQYIE